MREINGKRYEQVPATDSYDPCNKCVAYDDNELCGALRGDCHGKIWKEIEMKSALELVESVIQDCCPGSPPFCRAVQLKAAIEREQSNAIQMRPVFDELQQRDGNTTNTLSNILSRWLPEKQKSLVRGIMGESMIEMRPISELPDKVPEGCVVVVVGSDGIVDFFSSIQLEGLAEYVNSCARYDSATNFYILPLPIAARNLHPCYMPGCGASPMVYDVSPTKDKPRWVVTCDKCNTVGPIKTTKEEAEKAWGYQDGV